MRTKRYNIIAIIVFLAATGIAIGQLVVLILGKGNEFTLIILMLYFIYIGLPTDRWNAMVWEE